MGLDKSEFGKLSVLPVVSTRNEIDLWDEDL